MTLPPPTPAPDGHLDDEATLDAVDGVLATSRQAHLEACASCQAELANQLAVRDAVAGPTPPVDPAAREAAIAAALDAADPIPASPAASAAAPGAAGDTLHARRQRRWARPTGSWLGVAAVVLLLVVALPLLASLGGGDDDGDQRAAGGDDTAASDAGEEGASILAAPSAVDVGDLGDLDPAGDLRPVAERALGSEAAPSGGEAPAGDDAADQDQRAEEEQDADDGAEEAEGSAAAGTPSPAPAGGAEGPCAEEVRGALPTLGTLLLVGTATVDGRPARVLGFDAPATDRPSVAMVVVATAGCELVTFQSYARP